MTSYLNINQLRNYEVTDSPNTEPRVHLGSEWFNEIIAQSYPATHVDITQYLKT